MPSQFQLSGDYTHLQGVPNKPQLRQYKSLHPGSTGTMQQEQRAVCVSLPMGYPVGVFCFHARHHAVTRVRDRNEVGHITTLTATKDEHRRPRPIT